MLFMPSLRGKKYPVIEDEVADTRKHPDMNFMMEHLAGIGFEYLMGNNFYAFCDFNVGILLLCYIHSHIIQIIWTVPQELLNSNNAITLLGQLVSLLINVTSRCERNQRIFKL